MVSQEKLQEMQFLEQNLQSLMMQKQAFQMELSETKAALKELDNSGDDVFKLVGQLMLKTDKKKMKEMQREVKLLEKKKAGMEKMYEKVEAKAYDNIKVTERIYNLLIDNKKQAFLSKKLATIVRDVKVDFDLNDMWILGVEFRFTRMFIDSFGANKLNNDFDYSNGLIKLGYKF